MTQTNSNSYRHKIVATDKCTDNISECLLVSIKFKFHAYGCNNFPLKTNKYVSKERI